jgi:hypothetical protein
VGVPSFRSPFTASATVKTLGGHPHAQPYAWTAACALSASPRAAGALLHCLGPSRSPARSPPCPARRPKEPCAGSCCTGRRQRRMSTSLSYFRKAQGALGVPPCVRLVGHVRITCLRMLVHYNSDTGRTLTAPRSRCSRRSRRRPMGFCTRVWKFVHGYWTRPASASCSHLETRCDFTGLLSPPPIVRRNPLA